MRLPGKNFLAGSRLAKDKQRHIGNRDTLD